MPAKVQGWPGIWEDIHWTGTQKMWPSFYNKMALCPSYAIPDLNVLEHGGSEGMRADMHISVRHQALPGDVNTQKNDGTHFTAWKHFTKSYIIKKMIIYLLKMTRYSIITMPHNRELCYIYIDTVIYQILCVLGKIQACQTQWKNRCSSTSLMLL